jgi:hypothetical protein
MKTIHGNTARHLPNANRSSGDKVEHNNCRKRSPEPKSEARTPTVSAEYIVDRSPCVQVRTDGSGLAGLGRTQGRFHQQEHQGGTKVLRGSKSSASSFLPLPITNAALIWKRGHQGGKEVAWPAWFAKGSSARQSRRSCTDPSPCGANPLAGHAADCPKSLGQDPAPTA